MKNRSSSLDVDLLSDSLLIHDKHLEHCLPLMSALTMGGHGRHLGRGRRRKRRRFCDHNTPQSVHLRVECLLISR